MRKNIKLKNFNSIRNTQRSILFFILFLYGLLTIDCGLTFGQDKDDHLTTKKNIEADYISFIGDRANWPTAPLEGEIFYNSTEKLLKYFDGTQWQSFGAGGGPKTVASKIVAAANSLDKTAADYVCDGIDDQIEIQAAIDILGASGGSVYLLEGTYLISNSIKVSSSVAIIGAGSNTIITPKDSASAFTHITNADLTNGNSNILLQNFKLVGKNSQAVPSSGIYFYKVTNSKIEKLWMNDVYRGVAAIYFNSSSNNNISNCHLYRCGTSTEGASGLRGAIILYSNSNNNIITNYVCDSKDFESAVTIYSSLNNIVADNIFIDCAAYGGIRLSDARNNIVMGNNMISCFNSGIHFEHFSHRNIISSNNLSNNAAGIDNEYKTFSGVSTSEYNIISDNVITCSAGAQGVGIVLTGEAHNTLISGNLINFPFTSTVTLQGVLIYRGNKCLVSNNQFIASIGNATSYGINLFTGLTDTYLLGNNLDAWVPGKKVVDTGSATKYTDKTKTTLESKKIDINNSSYNLDLATRPQTYVSLNPSVNVTLTLSNGKAAGDLCILDNRSNVNSVTLKDSDANINLFGTSDRKLDQYDTLELIWNGTEWLEIKYTPNT